MSRVHYFLFYMSCFGLPEVTRFTSRANALAVVAYLKRHPVAYPLYIVKACQR